jgi:steroid 5-alpha reductase family enzyme
VSALHLASAGLLLACMLALWVVSLRLADASIADLFWGPGFGLVAGLCALLAPPSPRGLLLAALAGIWGLRLGMHLLARWRGHGEDRRYRAMRAARGPSFPLASLFTVFLLQGALLWVVSLPLQVGIGRGGVRPLGWLDGVGLALYAAGLAFEAVGDAQLARFLADPSSRGQVMQTGLWRYTRHPNYFGDALLWWGMGLLAAGAGAWWTLVGPALMTFLLLRVSGVALLERDLAERRPGYADYVARTSAFLPWPPRRRAGGPATADPGRGGGPAPRPGSPARR